MFAHDLLQPWMCDIDDTATSDGNEAETMFESKKLLIQGSNAGIPMMMWHYAL